MESKQMTIRHMLLTVNDIDSWLVSLNEASKPLFIWFDINLIKNTADKCNFLLSSNEKKIKIGSHENANTKYEILGLDS